MMKALILGIWLGIQGYMDFKYREIPVWFSLFGGAIGMLFCVMEHRDIRQVILSCLPGVCALIFSWVSKEVMGYGDGLVLLILGSFMSLPQLFSTVLLAFGIAGMVALVLLVIFRKTGRYRIPFIPFLSIAYGIEYVIKLGEITL